MAQPKARNLENEPVKSQLIKELALSNKTQRALSQDYGVSQAAISMFRARHMDEIDAVGDMQAIEGELLPAIATKTPQKFPMDLWITDKEKRLRAMQEDAEVLEGSDDVEDIKTRLAIFRMVEESLGQAEPKMTVKVGKQVNYTIEGISLEDLS
jgi:hypothetical protein